MVSPYPPKKKLKKSKEMFIKFQPLRGRPWSLSIPWNLKMVPLEDRLEIPFLEIRLFFFRFEMLELWECVDEKTRSLKTNSKTIRP